MLCSVEGCDRPNRARGWCATHYAHFRRIGAAGLPKLKCSVEGCDRQVYGFDYCELHYHRLQRLGRVDVLRPTASDRFWSKVDKTGECWLWTDALTDLGYGKFSRGGRGSDVKAHRFALEMALGRRLGAGEFACHACDNPTCVRNDDEGLYEVRGIMLRRRGHLFLGSAKDNTGDMVQKGRQRWWGRSSAA